MIYIYELFVLAVRMSFIYNLFMDLRMVAEPCYKALEEQIIKNKAVRETVFQVLGVLIKKYNHGTSCLIKLVQV